MYGIGPREAPRPGAVAMSREESTNGLPPVAPAIRLGPAGEGHAGLLHALHDEPTVRRLLGRAPGRTLDATRETLRQNPANFHVIESDGAPIGYAAYVQNACTGQMDVRIVIAAEHRGRGAAGEALALMIRRWEASFPDRPIALTVRRDNAAAKRVLAKSGFRKVGGYDDDFGHSQHVYEPPRPADPPGGEAPP